MNLTYPEIDPVIFSFSVGNFEFALRWYALSYIAGILGRSDKSKIEIIYIMKTDLIIFSFNF